MVQHKALEILHYHRSQGNRSLVIKGIVHPKMIIHSLSTHPYVDGGVGEVFESTKLPSGVSVVSRVVAKFNTIEEIRDSSSDISFS